MEDSDEYKGALSQAKTLEEIGLKLNDKIEVRWLIERDEEPVPKKKWWGARVIELDPENPKIVTLRYDADEGFEASRNQVLFLSEVYLYDIEQRGEQPFRREGDLVDTSECEQMHNDIVTFGDLVEEDDEIQEPAEAELQELPHSVQVQVAERFEQLKSGFIDFVREITEERGPNPLIKEDDITNFFTKLRSKDSKNP